MRGSSDATPTAESDGRVSGIAAAAVMCLGAWACSGGVTEVEVARPGDPVYEVTSVGVQDGVVSVDGISRNPSPEAIRYEVLAPCAVTLQVREAGPGGGEAPAWDQLAWFNTRPGGCKRAAIPLTLRAGESRPLGASARVADILGDSLPAGVYGVDLVVWEWSPSRGPKVLEGGEVILGEE